MNFVGEENRAAPALPIEARLSDRATQVFHPREDCRQRHKPSVGFLGQQPPQCCLARTWWAPQDQRRQRTAAFDQAPQDTALADQMFLSNELAESARPHSISQGRRGCGIGGRTTDLRHFWEQSCRASIRHRFRSAYHNLKL